MKLAIDCDGVIFDFVDSFMCYIERIGNPYKAKLFGIPVSWNMWEWMGIEKPQFAKYLEGYAADGGFSSGNFMDTYTENSLRNLSSKHEIIILTARHDNLHDYKTPIINSTLQWLDVNNIKYHDILFVRDKSVINADIYFEDAVHHLEKFHSKNKFAVCYNQPYNQAWKGHRVKDWKEFESLVDGFDKYGK